MRFCTIPSCNNQYRARGVCKDHYNLLDEIREKKRGWDRTHKDLLSKNKKRDLIEMKKKVFEHYGKECVCCNETIFGFLTIDHINGKASMNHSSDMKGKKLYSWLIRNNFPEGFQTLCWNCNSGSNANGGICPHKLTKCPTALAI